jgi:P27 family predicted phage terminase small subunit
MRGRKPIPAPVNLVALPTLVERIPPPPETLPEAACKIWDETARMLVARGLWDTDIVAAVEAFCIMRSRFLHANRMIDETGGPLHRAQKGGLTYNVWVGVANNAFDRMVKLACELGLTPVSRTRAARAKGSRAGSVPASKYLRNVE